MTFDWQNSTRRHDRVERDNACSQPAREDLSRQVQRLYDNRDNSCRVPESADRFLPPYSNEPGERFAPADQSRFGGVVDQLRQHRTRLLLDASAPPEHRLAAVRELARAGTNNVTVRGNDGQPYKLRLETEPAGSREMVHLYLTGADGKEHTVLRGIANQKGEFEREQDKCGNAVGWYGAGAAQLQNILGSDSPDLQRRTVRGENLNSLRGRTPQIDPLDCRIDPGPFRRQERDPRYQPDPRDGQDSRYRQDPRDGQDPRYRPDPRDRQAPWCEPDQRIRDPRERQDPREQDPRYGHPYRQNPYERDPYHGRPYQQGPREYCDPRDQNPYNGGRPNPYNGWRRNPYDRPNNEEFAPPRDGSNERSGLRPFDQPSDQSGRQWLDRAAQDARNQTRQLVKTTAGIYLRSGMTVDADGSPRARQIDPDGQLNTSMRYADNKSVNAEVVPYMVLPGGAYQKYGVQLGDMVLVRNTDNGRMAVAVFADVGPRNKTGEGSMELAREMGLNPSPTKGGTSKASIEYLVLPNTHGTKPRNEQELMARIAEQRRRFGIG
ncbi:MAG: hypothetical protein JST89_09140 [Cyanobacteria bacterium SZAS-4]|nr:hypothetical protein [Cyanobacteria bacterium SZAS-4]